jgi:hypothetical protein
MWNVLLGLASLRSRCRACFPGIEKGWCKNSCCVQLWHSPSATFASPEMRSLVWCSRHICWGGFPLQNHAKMSMCTGLALFFLHLCCCTTLLILSIKLCSLADQLTGCSRKAKPNNIPEGMWAVGRETWRSCAYWRWPEERFVGG